MRETHPPARSWARSTLPTGDLGGYATTICLDTLEGVACVWQ